MVMVMLVRRFDRTFHLSASGFSIGNNILEYFGLCVCIKQLFLKERGGKTFITIAINGSERVSFANYTKYVVLATCCIRKISAYDVVHHC